MATGTPMILQQGDRPLQDQQPSFGHGLRSNGTKNDTHIGYWQQKLFILVAPPLAGNASPGSGLQ